MLFLRDISTQAPAHCSRPLLQAATRRLCRQMASLQRMLYAQQRFSLLVILQGVDASGKDGAIEKVFSALNPAGVVVKDFKKPDDKERKYDFLWRVHQYVPPKGMIHIFNRSHYEDVLVPLVEGTLSDEACRRRYAFIDCFERLLSQENETCIIKFYLHISPEQQYRRLMERRTNPRKYWKYSPEDWIMAAQWDDYIRAYEQLLAYEWTIPWHIVPADQNWYRNYTIAKLVVDQLQALSLFYPPRSE